MRVAECQHVLRAVCCAHHGRRRKATDRSRHRLHLLHPRRGCAPHTHARIQGRGAARKGAALRAAQGRGQVVLPLALHRVRPPRTSTTPSRTQHGMTSPCDPEGAEFIPNKRAHRRDGLHAFLQGAHFLLASVSPHSPPHPDWLCAGSTIKDGYHTPQTLILALLRHLLRHSLRWHCLADRCRAGGRLLVGFSRRLGRVLANILG